MPQAEHSNALLGTVANSATTSAVKKVKKANTHNPYFIAPINQKVVKPLDETNGTRSHLHLNGINNKIDPVTKRDSDRSMVYK